SAPESEFALLGVCRAFYRPVFQYLPDFSANGFHRRARDVDGGTDCVQHWGDARDAGSALTSADGSGDLCARSCDVVDLAGDGPGPDRGDRDWSERFRRRGGAWNDESVGRNRGVGSDG